MDCHDYITVSPERKRGQHLGREERGAIQQLKKHLGRRSGIVKILSQISLRSDRN